MKIAVLNSHPIQYFAPMYRSLAQDDEIELIVYYCSRQGIDTYMDSQFKTELKWDTNLLEGYKYRFLPNFRSTASLSSFFSLVNPAIIRELRRERFDVLWVHGHSYATNILAIAAARILRIPVFMRCETHLLLQRSQFKQLVRRPILYLFYRNFAMFLAIGTRNREFYLYHGVPDSRIAIVPYTVDNDYFIRKSTLQRKRRNEIRESLGLPTEYPIILYASKLTARKNPLRLLEAYRRVHECGVQATLIFVGSGNELPHLQAYVEEHKLQRVYFLGFRNQSELPKLYAASDIFVLPSQNEPWGLVINEAMCAALPIVATDEIGAVPDLVHAQENGYLFSVDDISSLSNHLEVLCRNRELRKTMGEASLRIIEEWSYQEVRTGIKHALKMLKVDSKVT